MPDAAPAIAGYRDAREQLWEALAQTDHLVRAQVVRWHLTLAAGKPEQLWGMLQVGDGEVEAYLAAPFVPPAALPPGLEPAMAPHWEAARQAGKTAEARRRASAASVDLRLDRLTRLWTLSDPARTALLVALLPELDQRYRRLYGWLLDDASRSQPTVELILHILHPLLPDPLAGRALFAPEEPLMSAPLLRFGDEAATGALPLRPVRIEPRIVDFLLGGDRPDGRLAGLLAIAPEGPDLAALVLPEAVRSRLAALAGRWGRTDAAPRPCLLLSGPEGVGKRAAAAALCRSGGPAPLVIDTAGLLAAPCGATAAIDLVYREARLTGRPVFWDGAEALLGEAAPAPARAHLIARAESEAVHSLFGCVDDVDLAGRFRQRPPLRLDLPAPPFPDRLELWRRNLGAAGVADAATDAASDLLATSFRLAAGPIADAVADARNRAAERAPADPRPLAAELTEACRQRTGPGLARLARRIDPKPGLSFGDLVLPPSSRRQIDDLRRRIRLRGHVQDGQLFGHRLAVSRGLVALFTGSSGTGKTMTAQLLAQESGVSLYKVDISTIVSKYVGETEKNLEQVFAESENANAILFFDEADALFGKRGEIKDARDRWANLEVNYLLQRIEDYSGVIVLATNLRQNLDSAFLRRIHSMVEFPFPDEEARRRIWQGLLPPRLPLAADLDIPDIARRFALAGGNIRNVIVDAVYRALDAAPETPELTTAHLALGLAREYLKLGKPITPSEWGERLYAQVGTD